MDTDFQANAFDKLVLPLDVKNTLEAISCSYARAKDNSKRLDADLIKGKGEGKIFLLHGPPGTGKTLSAEVVAELTERPLLSLTCGDLGTTAVEVEKNLSRYMGYGELWGAVVLLDAADIYLQARNLFEVERNSLVSGKWSSISTRFAKLMAPSFLTGSGVLQRVAVPYYKPRQVSSIGLRIA